MIPATLVVVCYRTEHLDLSWVPADAEVIGVLNDATPPAVTPDRAVRWITPASNVGFGAAVNLASQQARGRRLVVVNPDCHLQPVHWDALTSAGSEVVGTVPLKSPDGRETTVRSPYPSPTAFLLGAWRMRHRLRRLLPLVDRLTRQGTAARGRRPLASHWVSGAAFSVDRDRFRAVGGFDEEFFLYYEDVDLCQRLAAAFPDMEALVADVPPGRHQVGGSGTPAVALLRRTAARQFARKQRGRLWRLAEALVPSLPSQPQHDPCDVLIVGLGRAKGMGELRRVQTWVDITQAGGLRAAVISVTDVRYRPRLADLVVGVADVIRGRAVPEALRWSPRAVAAEILARRPDVVIAVTARCYRPELASSGARVVLDYVDRLSDNYRQRSRILGRATPRGLGFRLLAVVHRRFESGEHEADLLVAAGRSDASRLHTEFVPNTVSVRRTDGTAAADEVDLVFVGNLAFAPNLDALRELEAVDAALRARGRHLRVRIAGARPGPSVWGLAQNHGWEVDPDFEDEADVYRTARIAVVPIAFANGIQNKVLDALAHGTPVICYAAAAEGLPVDAPVVTVPTRDVEGFASAICQLLDSEASRRDLARRGTAWIERHLSPSRWVNVLPCSPTKGD